jgi:CBS domain-containing protein
MRVADCMSPKVWTIRPSETLRAAANKMLDHDVGALPVTEGERLVGMITDRDIAVRAVARGLGPDAFVQDVMSLEPVHCAGDHEVEGAAGVMREHKVRRLPVLDAERRVVGIITTGDLAQQTRPETWAQTFAGVSEPGGRHSQTTLH